jgi:hypothetical protein
MSFSKSWAARLAYDFSHDRLESREEVDLIARFLQLVHDYGDLFDDLDSGQRVETRFQLDAEIAQLARAGFLVYGTQVQRTEMIGGRFEALLTGVLRILRTSNARVPAAHKPNAGGESADPPDHKA